MVKEIDGTRVREIDERVVTDNDPVMEAELLEQQLGMQEHFADCKAESIDNFRAMKPRPQTPAEQMWRIMDEIDQLEAMPATTPTDLLAKRTGLSTLRGELAALDALVEVPPARAPSQPLAAAVGDWVALARTRATEIVKEQRVRDLYPSQENMGDTIAAEFRKAGIVGTDGKPLSGASIKRHALKGISSAIVKQLSTTIRQGK